ncbi:MAG: hypothetical protein JW871_06075 [Endomicrobiales bacterium]|nr:hypothetical protein [Endomicrobiales bacterium]
MMDRKNIISLIILDIFVMILALGLIIFRYYSLTKMVSAEIESPSYHTSAAEEITPDTKINQNKKTQAEKRNLRFTFRHSQAKKVEIIGDFNDWIPQSMEKGKNHLWKIDLSISPGEYAYNFVIDGRPIRDPNNPKVCNVGRGFPNSFLQVKSKK